MQNAASASEPRQTNRLYLGDQNELSLIVVIGRAMALAVTVMMVLDVGVCDVDAAFCLSGCFGVSLQIVQFVRSLCHYFFCLGVFVLMSRDTLLS